MAALHPVAYPCGVAGPDFETQIKQLQATMHTIEQVLDVDDMRKEIAELGEQVAAPDLWDDQANAQKITGRLSTLQGELERFTSLQSRIDDLSSSCPARRVTPSPSPRPRPSCSGSTSPWSSSRCAPCYRGSTTHARPW